MSAHTINIASETLLSFEATRAGMEADAWIEQYVNGHLATLQASYDADQKAKNQAEYDAKVANAEKWEPTMSAYEKLPKEKQDQVDAILASAVAEEPVTP